MNQETSSVTIPSKWRQIKGIIIGLICIILAWIPILLPGLEFLYFLAAGLPEGLLIQKKRNINGKLCFAVFASVGVFASILGLVQTLPKFYLKISLATIMLILWGIINYFIAKLIQTPRQPTIRLLSLTAFNIAAISLANKILPVGTLFTYQMISYQPSRWYIGLTRTAPSLITSLILAWGGIFFYLIITKKYPAKLPLPKHLLRIGLSLTVPMIIILYGYFAAPILKEEATIPTRQLVLVQNNVSTSEFKIMENSNRITNKILAQLEALGDDLRPHALIFTNEIVSRNYLIQQDYKNYHKLIALARDIDGEVFWGTYFSRKAEKKDAFNVYAAIVLIDSQGLEDKTFRTVAILEGNDYLIPQVGDPDSSFITTRDGIKFLVTQCGDIAKTYRGLKSYTDYDLLYASANNTRGAKFGKLDIFSLMIQKFASFLCAKDNKFGVIVLSRGKSCVLNNRGRTMIESVRNQPLVITCDIQDGKYRIFTSQ